MHTNTIDLVIITGRKFLVVCLTLFFSSLLYGAEVDSLTAKLVAKNFYLSRVEQSGKYLKKETLQDISFELVHKEIGDPGNQSLLKSGGVPLPLYYIFNAGEDEGYVIVPGDDCAPAVLGFSFEGSYSGENQPPAFTELMSGYEQQITQIIEDELIGSEKILEMWETYGKETMGSDLKAVEDVSPLIETRWNQGCYYNYFCPTDAEGPCGRVYVGCLAVAVAQIMNYWEYPAHVDNIPGYNHPTYGWIDEINNIDYNWSAMTNTLSSSSNQQAVDAVSGLLYHVGVADLMNYSPKGSAGSSSRALYALQNIFNYSSTSSFISKSSYSNSEWDQIIRNELDLNRPVYSQGSNEGGGCHAFVLDGYSGTNYFHFNWGWGGSSDGYFYLDPLSENSSLYPLRQWIFVGLEPYNLDVSPNNRSVSSNSGTTSYSVNTDVDWSVEDDVAWLTASRSNSTTISVSYSANTTGSSRIAHIRAYDTGGIEETVTLTQGPGEDCRDAYEPNEYFPSAASAYPTLGASSYTGSISATMDVEDDQDYYRLNITSPGMLTVRLTDPPVDIDMALAFGPEDWLTNSLGVGTSDETMAWAVTETGSYHIYAYAAYDEYSCGNYTLEVQWIPTSTGELWISPESRNVGSDFGSTSFAVTSSVAWNVEDDASWLTATNIDNHTISVSFTESTSSNSRTAHIRAYGSGGLEDIVTVVQDGSVPPCPDAYEENNSFGTAASPYPSLGASSYSGSIDATIHNASDDDYYRVYITSTGTLTVNMPSPPFDIDIQLANGSGEWLTNSVNTGTSSESMTWHVGSSGYYYIFAYGYQGASSCSEYQLGVEWTGGTGLDVSPNNQSVSYQAGTTTYTVSSDSDWNVEDGASWLTATWTNSTTISVSYSENTGSTRVANIRAYASGGAEETVTLTQYGTTQICPDDHEPNEYFNEAASPYPTLGSSSYTGSISATIDDTDDQDYFRLNITEAGTLTVNMFNPPIDIDLALAAGTEEWLTNSLGVGTSSETMSWEVTEAETGSYHIYAYAAYDDFTCDNYNLEVQWAPEEPEFLNVSPQSRTVSCEAGCVTFSVSSNLDWSVEDNASWLTTTKTSSSTITVCFDMNTTGSPRTVIIRVWYQGHEYSVSVTQLECRQANLTYHPDYNDLSVSGTEVDLSIRILNAGGAPAQESYVAYYLSSDAIVSIGDYLIGEDYVLGILAGAYSDESLNVDVTSANSEIPGGSYYVGYIIDYQEVVEESSESDNRFVFNSPRITVPVHLKVSPESKTVEYPSGSTSFSVNSNVEWSVVDDADWMTATKTSETTIGVSYTENTSGSSRTANIQISGGGMTEIVSLIQKMPSYPNLEPYQHTGWADRIIVSKEMGTRIDEGISKGWPVYIDIAWKNTGDVSAGSHESCLYLGDQQIECFELSSLTSGSYVVEEDIEFTFNQEGTQTLRLVVDVNSSVFESNEGDNVYEKVINVVTAIDNHSLQDELIVYPNPTGGWINLKIQNARKGRYFMEIMDAVGKVVWNWQVDNQGAVMEERFNLNDNPAGIYFIRVTSETDTSVRKIILRD